MQREARSLGLEINWSKTKIQETGIDSTNNDTLSLVGQNVEMVDSFFYLSYMIHKPGNSVADITRRMAIARNCMKTLDKAIWRSSISLRAKIPLYNCYILPVVLYGAGLLDNGLGEEETGCLRQLLP